MARLHRVATMSNRGSSFFEPCPCAACAVRRVVYDKPPRYVQGSLALDDVRVAVSAFEREARALIAPVLTLLERGEISIDDLSTARRGSRVRNHPLIAAIEQASGGKRLPDRKLGIEKDGVVIAANVVYKIGLRAEREANAYASASPDVKPLLAACIKLGPAVVAMERATPVCELSAETAAAYYGNRSLRRRLSWLTEDAHDGNVGKIGDTFKLIDYSFDDELGPPSPSDES